MSKQKTVIVFPFADPDIKYTMMDNYLFDHIMPIVKPNAWKILCLIIRKTKGWHKVTDQISFSQIKIGTGISSDETVNNALKQLVGKGYILTKKGGQWDATEYEINQNFSTTIIEVEREPTTEIEAIPTTEIEAIPTTIIEDTKETYLKKVNKASSANADYSRPISFLSEKEVKALKLPLSEWKLHLADEQAERGRKGVIRFLEGKIVIGPLLPDTDEARYLFGRLQTEAEAQGRNGPKKFPSLACKEKFNRAVKQLNGTFEQAINSGLEAGILGIPRLVQYISSSKWKEGKNGQSRTKNTQGRFPDRSQSDTEKDTNFEPGNGRTPEMQAQLEAAFAPKPG